MVVGLLDKINVRKNLNILLTASKKRHNIQYTQKYSEIPRNTQKYPEYPEIPENTQEYPEIPESKKDTRKYPILYFNTPTRPEPDPLPGIFSIPDPTRLSLENHRVAGNPKYRVLPYISGKPEVSGITRYFGYSQT